MRILQQIKSVVTSVLSKTYKPSVNGPFAERVLAGALAEPYPPLTLAIINQMLRDPRVALALATIKGPITSTRIVVTPDDEERYKDVSCVRVKSENPSVATFVARQLVTFWKNGLHKALRAIEFGSAGAEIVYKLNGQILEFDDLRDFCLVDIVGVLTSNGKFAGIKVKGTSSGDLEIVHPKAYWHTHRDEYGSWFGKSRLISAYPAWFQKNRKDGALQIRWAWYHRNAYTGRSVRYPDGSSQINGIERSNLDIARQLVESAKTGAVLALPSKRDENGNYQWEWNDASPAADIPGIREYCKDLDQEITEGAEISPEVIHAEGTGAYAGRTVPERAFYTTLDQELNDIVNDFDAQCLRWLVETNFGRGMSYDIQIDPVTPRKEGAQFSAPMQNSPAQAPMQAIQKMSLDPVRNPDKSPMETLHIEAGLATTTVLARIRSKVIVAVQESLDAKEPAEETIRRVRAIIRAEIPELERIIDDTAVAGWIIGASEAYKKLPSKIATTLVIQPIEAIGSELETTVGAILRASTKTLLFQDREPTIWFPALERAADDIKHTSLMTRQQFNQLGENIRQEGQIFIDGEPAAQKAAGIIEDLVREGPTLEAFTQQIDNEVFGGKSPLHPSFVESLYRKGIQTGYGSGLDYVLDQPEIATEFPYQIDASIDDARRSRACEWFSKNGIGGTAIYRRDDPLYRRYRTPRHWNCRTGRTPLSVADAARMGVSEAIEWLGTGIAPEEPWLMSRPPDDVLASMFPEMRE